MLKASELVLFPPLHNIMQHTIENYKMFLKVNSLFFQSQFILMIMVPLEVVWWTLYQIVLGPYTCTNFFLIDHSVYIGINYFFHIIVVNYKVFFCSRYQKKEQKRPVAFTCVHFHYILFFFVRLILF
jgi:hypothetical protein